MTEQNDNPIFDSKKYAQQVSDLVVRLQAISCLKIN